MYVHPFAHQLDGSDVEPPGKFNKSGLGRAILFVWTMHPEHMEFTSTQAWDSETLGWES